MSHESKIVTLRVYLFRGKLRLHRCWWRMLRTKCVGDKFEMLVTDSGCWWPIKYIEKITNITQKVANIIILPPTSPSTYVSTYVIVFKSNILVISSNLIFWALVWSSDVDKESATFLKSLSTFKKVICFKKCVRSLSTHQRDHIITEIGLK